MAPSLPFPASLLDKSKPTRSPIGSWNRGIAYRTLLAQAKYALDLNLKQVNKEQYAKRIANT